MLNTGRSSRTRIRHGPRDRLLSVTFAPVWDGLAIAPAPIGGLALGLVVELVTRYLTGGAYTTRPMAT